MKVLQERRGQRGMVLVASLLLLLVVTIMALGIFRSYGVQEKIASNVREKQRALNAAETAQQFAENWLISNATTSAATTCSTLLNGNLGAGQICSNTLAQAGITVANWPALAINGTDVGVTYTPVADATHSMSVTTSAASGTYYAPPRFYITDVGLAPPAFGTGEVYKIDAIGLGGTANSVAIVESTFAVTVKSWDLTQ
ncbi:MAG TPA: PilX N-terminal domain-containing pilus assembly protein [Steroidobacteraceae bacterium]|nr:PilX N-terminal domain-containing pilus assembly protein [Steroidobacteraceae bacterium]